MLRRHALLAAGCAVNVVCGLAASAVFPTMPLRAQQLGISSWHAGSILGCYSLAYLLACPLVGSCVAQLGCKALTVLGLVSCALSTALLGWVECVPLLYACRSVQGIGTAAAEVAVMALVASRCPKEELGRLTGYLELSQGLGWVLGPPAAGALHELFGFEWTFGLIGVLVKAISVLTGWLLHQVPSVGRGHEAAEATSAGPGAGPSGTNAAVPVVTLMRPRLMLLVVGVVTFAASMGALYANLVVHCAASPAQAGLLVLLVALAYIGAAPCTGHLIDANLCSGRTVLIGGLLLGSASYALLSCSMLGMGGAAPPYADEAAWSSGVGGSARLAGVAVACVALGLAESLVLVPAFPELLSLMPPSLDDEVASGIVSALFNAAWSGGEAAGPVLSVWPVQRWGFPRAMLACALLNVATACAVTGATMRDARRPPDWRTGDDQRSESEAMYVKRDDPHR